MISSAPEYDVILEEMGAGNEAVICLDAGLATSMKTHRFARAFPQRYFNLGIAEQNAVGVASGLARRGFIPLMHTFSNFLTRRAHDQMVLSAVWPGCPVKFIAGSCGVFDGRNGPSHMATDDLATASSMPGMMVVEPGDLRQTRALLDQIIQHPGPAYLRLRRYGQSVDCLGDAFNPGGTSVIQTHDAPQFTLVLGGSMLEEGLFAAKLVQDEGLALDILHVAVLKPLDAAPIIASAEKSKCVVTVENHIGRGGFGESVALALGPLGIAQHRFHLPDAFIPAGDATWQLHHCQLDAHSLARRMLMLLKGDSYG